MMNMGGGIHQDYISFIILKFQSSDNTNKSIVWL